MRSELRLATEPRAAPGVGRVPCWRPLLPRRRPSLPCPRMLPLGAELPLGALAAASLLAAAHSVAALALGRLNADGAGPPGAAAAAGDCRFSAAARSLSGVETVDASCGGSRTGLGAARQPPPAAPPAAADCEPSTLSSCACAVARSTPGPARLAAAAAPGACPELPPSWSWCRYAGLYITGRAGSGLAVLRRSDMGVCFCSGPAVAPRRPQRAAYVRRGHRPGPGPPAQALD